jgi:hypothetical protein
MTPTEEMDYIEALVADPALQAKAQDSWRSFFDVAKSRGFYIIGGVNDRIPGWQTVHSYLKPYTTPYGEKAGLAIFSTCTNLIRTLPELIHDDTRVEDVNTDCDDHAPDALRYGLMYFWKKVQSLLDVKEFYKPPTRDFGKDTEEDTVDYWYTAPSILSSDF